MDALEKCPEEVSVILMAGHTAHHFNYENNTLNINGTLLSHAISMKDTNSEILQDTYSILSCEMRHAYDILIAKIPMVKGKILELTEVKGKYITELNAWSSEARAYIDIGVLDKKIVLDWESFNLESEDTENIIWQRLIHYTDVVFNSHFPNPDGNNWSRYRDCFKHLVKEHINYLQPKVKAKIEARKAPLS